MIVVIGQEKSGTTMLMKVLRKLGASIDDTEAWLDSRKVRVVLMKTDLDMGDKVDYIKPNNETIEDFVDVMNEYESESISWKLPSFIYFWPELIKHLDKYHPTYIVITRNPYATALSEMKHCGDMSLRECIEMVHARQKMVNDFILNNECLVVQYEEFFVKPKKVLNEIKKYIGSDKNINEAMREIGNLPQCVWHNKNEKR